MILTTLERIEEYRAGLAKLIAHCEQQQQLQSNQAAAVVYKLPSNPGRRERHRRFAGRRGPYGRVIGAENDHDVVLFYADELLNFLWLELADVDSGISNLTRGTAKP